jgi:ABC-type nitrate/sulfonate/bicarbonate transport system permease component
MKREKMRSRKILIWQLGFTAAILAAAEILVDTGRIDKLFIAAPSKTVIEFVKLFKGFAVFQDIGTTLLEYFIGFSISVVLGISLGVLVGRSAKLEKYLKPFVSALMSIPKVTLVPVLLVWFGIGIKSKIFFTIFFSFFYIFFNTITGVKETPRNYLSVARSLGASSRQTVFKVILPSAVPTIFAALRIAATAGFLGTIFGEMLAANHGMGFQLTYSAGLYDTALLFAVTLIITLMSVIILKTIDFIEKKFFLYWKYQ